MSSNYTLVIGFFLGLIVGAAYTAWRLSAKDTPKGTSND